MYNTKCIYLLMAVVEVVAVVIITGDGCTIINNGGGVAVDTGGGYFVVNAGRQRHHRWCWWGCGCRVIVMTMSNSGSYLVTPVALQHYSSTPVALTYSGHGCAVILPLSTTLGLIPIQSLLHLTVNPALTWVLRVLNISPTLYHFHWTWPSPNSGRSLSTFKAVYLSL